MYKKEIYGQHNYFGFDKSISSNFFASASFCFSSASFCFSSASFCFSSASPFSALFSKFFHQSLVAHVFVAPKKSSRTLGSVQYLISSASDIPSLSVSIELAVA
jgi:hypothetical protein